MSNTVTLPKDSFAALMSQTVNVLKNVGPQLEKLATIETQQAAFAKQAADKLVEAGIIKAADAADAERELAEGFDKIANMVDFVLKAKRQPPTMGKSAEAAATKSTVMSADDAFNRKLGLS